MSRAILIISFSRFEHMLARIAEAKKQGMTIYLHLDRAKKESEKSLENDRCINFVQKHQNLFQEFRIAESNLGIKKGVIEAIDWFFQFEEEGIIIEDDIEFNNSFVDYAFSQLNLLRQEKEISSISGDRFNFGLEYGNSPFLSIFGSSWGWATWRDRWEFFRKNMHNFPQRHFLVNCPNLDLTSRLFWLLIFLDTHHGRIDTWDYVWLWHNFNFSKFALVPPTNLTLNHGFNLEATNTRLEKKPSWLSSEIGEVVNMNSKIHFEVFKDYDEHVNRYVHGVKLGNLLRHFLKNPFTYIKNFINLKM